MIHFFSRGALDAEGVGPALILQCVQRGLVHDPADFFFLTKEQLESLDRMAEKSATNALNAIENSKHPPLPRLIYALGIRHVGDHVAEVLARRFGSLDRLAEASEEELAQTMEIGPVIAQSVAVFFRQKQTRELLDKLRKAGVEAQAMSAPAATALAVNIAGKTYVLTGTLPIPRPEIEKLIKQLGGKVASSVSRRTDYVLAGDSPGSKHEKALELRIPIIDWTVFSGWLPTGAVEHLLGDQR
jgi:DNA ligase (NAD+)